jgi:SOS response regulatory protein OraA/RecX
MDKEVSQIIVELLEQNQLSKNFGPKQIMSELQRCNISEERIPSWIQIQNKLSYYR